MTIDQMRERARERLAHAFRALAQLYFKFNNTPSDEKDLYVDRYGDFSMLARKIDVMWVEYVELELMTVDECYELKAKNFREPSQSL